MKIKIAENIRLFRKQHSFTQEQLAEALGVTAGAVHKWEAGQSVPEVKLLMELADLVEISVDTLLGYDRQSENIENRIERIKQYVLEKDLEEAIVEVEKALKKYPNNFDVVYVAAKVYMCKASEDKDEKSLLKSNEMFHNAITLLYQNKDSSINEVTILNYVGLNYLNAGQTEKAIEILKKNNICNMNSARIGFAYTMLKQPDEARSYLSNSYMSIINNVLHTIGGMALMYAQKKENAKIVSEGSVPQVPVLMFISNAEGINLDKTIWIDTAKNYAELLENAKCVELDCPHYVHDYEYERIAEEMKSFLNFN